MHPTFVIDWGPLQGAVSAYRLAVICAGVLAVAGTIAFAISRGVPRRQVAAVVLPAVVGAVAGARILGAINTDTAILERSFSAFSIWGALLGGLVGGLLGSLLWRRSAIPAGVLLDAAVVPAGMAIAVARTGCMCAGCCFGLPTHAAWGVTYPSGSNAHIANLDSSNLLDGLFTGPPPVHPVPIYDGAAAVIASGSAFWFYRRFVSRGRARPGASGMVFVAIYAAARIIIEHFRYHVPSVGSLTAGGWQLAFGIVAVAAFALVLNMVRYPTPVAAVSD